jgi:lipoprotein signal peptidase
MAAVLAGSIGNLIDRICQQGVTDFLSFHFGPMSSRPSTLPTMLIVCGTIIMILFLLIHPDWLSSDS